MSAPEKFAAYRPRKGDPIAYAGAVTGHVHRVEGALCWNAYADGSDPLPFIWCFRDGLNALHTWPGKDESKSAFCPGKRAMGLGSKAA